jgi:hypothetical protein
MWGDSPADQAAERQYQAQQWKLYARTKGQPTEAVGWWVHSVLPTLLAEIEVQHLCAAEMADGIEGITTTDD